VKGIAMALGYIFALIASRERRRIRRSIAVVWKAILNAF
jgi:hypothetical protein